MATSTMVLSYTDYSNEKFAISLPIARLTTANYAAHVAAITTLSAALALVTLGRHHADKLATSYSGAGTPGQRGPETARREIKALIRYYGATNHRRYTAEVPAVDPNLQHTNHDGLYVSQGSAINQAEWTAFGAALAADPFQTRDGEAIVILDVVDVGRAL